MIDARISSEVLEAVVDHFGCEADDFEFFTVFESPKNISSQWNECSRDLSHLSRSEKQDLLQRRIEFRPNIVGGVVVHLYNDVQTTKGQPRIKAAIIELADRCLVASY